MIVRSERLPPRGQRVWQGAREEHSRPRILTFTHTAKRQAVRRVVAGAAALFGSKAPGKVGILMYHRVAEHYPGVCRPTWNVTPGRFRRQLEGLLARGFKAWPLQKVIDCGWRGSAVPPRTFVVTFDDGYENIHRHAWPVLRELGVPATVFLATAYIGREAPFPFDDWPEAGSKRVPAHAWRPLSTAQCRELAAEGLVELGAHTHTHADFRNRPEDFATDLLRCIEFMRTEFGLTEVSFAFPFGYGGPALADIARRSGVMCGLTTQEGLADPAGDPYDWGRFEVAQADSAATIAACLDGWCDAVRRARHRSRVVVNGRRGAHGA